MCSMGKEYVQLGGKVGEQKASRSSAWQEAAMQHGPEQTPETWGRFAGEEKSCEGRAGHVARLGTNGKGLV